MGKNVTAISIRNLRNVCNIAVVRGATKDCTAVCVMPVLAELRVSHVVKNRWWTPSTWNYVVAPSSGR